MFKLWGGITGSGQEKKSYCIRHQIYQAFHMLCRIIYIIHNNNGTLLEWINMPEEHLVIGIWSDWELFACLELFGTKTCWCSALMFCQDKWRMSEVINVNSNLTIRWHQTYLLTMAPKLFSQERCVNLREKGQKILTLQICQICQFTLYRYLSCKL